MADPKTDPGIRVGPHNNDAARFAQSFAPPASVATALYFLLSSQIDGVERRLTDLSDKVDDTRTELKELSLEVKEVGRRMDRADAVLLQLPVTPTRR